MRLLVICLVILAVLGACGAVILVKKFIDAGNQSQGVNAPETGETVKTIFVLVADATLQPGTLIGTASYRWQRWPNDAVTENYFTETNNIAGVPEEIKEFKVRQSIFKGTPITKEMVFKTDTVGVLPGLLKNDMRAMSVSVRSYAFKNYYNPNESWDINQSRRMKISMFDKRGVVLEKIS